MTVSVQTVIFDDLLREHVRSVEDLDVLLLLCRDSERTWTASQVTAQLTYAPELVASVLRSLAKGDRAPVDALSEGYAFRPRTAEMRAAVAALAQASHSDRTDVLLRMSANAVNRLRRQARDTFALLLEVQQGRAGTKQTEDS